MVKYAFIPSRDGKSQTLIKLKTFLEKANFIVKVLVGESSIFEAYSNAVKEANVSAQDWVILCHDDIEIISSVDSFTDILNTHFKKPNAGFLGVAGARVLTHQAVWWGNYSAEHQPLSQNNTMRGAVFHGVDMETAVLDVFGRHGKAVVLDGVFLACKGAVLNSIQITQPKTFTSGWHFYDIFFTYQAFKKGYINVAAPIMLRHESVGTPEGSYEDNRKAFVDHFGGDLPVQV